MLALIMLHSKAKSMYWKVGGGGGLEPFGGIDRCKACGQKEKGGGGGRPRKWREGRPPQTVVGSRFRGPVASSPEESALSSSMSLSVFVAFFVFEWRKHDTTTLKLVMFGVWVLWLSMFLLRFLSFLYNI